MLRLYDGLLRRHVGNHETTRMERKPTLRRRILLRLAAVLVGLSPFLLCELVLRIGNVGDPQRTGDPLVGFDSVVPLFVKNGERWEIPKSRHEFFRPESFAATKPDKQFRIFCLGGSTVQGRPYQIETSFTTWLQINLNVADANRSWRVINCGGVSYASYRLVPILEEVLQHQPDLIILYTGHNEFLEDRSYQSVKTLSPFARKTMRQAFQSRTVRMLWQISRAESHKDQLPTEVDALLDYQGGLEHYRYDPQWRDSVEHHFRVNLRHMIQTCQNRNVPLILVDPLYNLQDSPPFKVAHSSRVTQEDKERFAGLWKQANETGTTLEERVTLLKRCIELDDEHAGVHYQLGKCLHALRKLPEAKRSFILAKDTDICPLRIRSPMLQTIVELAKQHNVPRLKLVEEFERRSHDGILGTQWFVDHVHPSIRGHQLIGDLLAEKMESLGIVELQGDWKGERRRAFKRHLGSLGELYAQHAKIRLEGLRKWSKGRGTKLKKGH